MKMVYKCGLLDPPVSTRKLFPTLTTFPCKKDTVTSCYAGLGDLHNIPRLWFIVGNLGLEVLLLDHNCHSSVTQNADQPQLFNGLLGS